MKKEFTPTILRKLKLYLGLLSLGSFTLLSPPKKVLAENFSFTQNVCVQKKDLYQTAFLKKSTQIEKAQNLVGRIRSIEVEYPLSPYFEIEKALEAYQTVKPVSYKSLQVIQNKKVDAKTLTQKIIENNKNLKKNEKELSSSLFDKVVSIITHNINDLLDKKDIDIGALDYKLSHLKLIEYKEFSYAYYSASTNVFGINLTSLQNLAQKSSFNKVLEQVVSHEVIHIVEGGTSLESRESSYRNRYGPSIRFDVLDVNSLYWNWYIEGATEQVNLNQNHFSTTLTYPNELKAIEAVKIPTVFLDTKRSTELEELVLQPDIQKIYTYFQCQNEREKMEILEMFYAMNLVVSDSYTSSSNDFYEKYEIVNGKRLTGNEKQDFQIDLKESIALTLTKQFYQNLSTSLSEKAYKVEDVFTLISMEEDELSRFLWYSNSSYKDKYHAFFEEYTRIQDMFLDELSKNIGLSLVELKDLYFSYHKTIETHNFKFLPNEKRVFYERCADSRKGDHKEAIAEVYESLSKTKQK